jgi:alpha-tubulin suppressor-like RCC1 family protein
MKFTKRFLISSIFLALIGNNSIAQNSLTGDGFGGRSWYQSHSYSTGAYCAYTVCGIDSQLYCWGGNAGGEFGNGNTTSSNTPIVVPGINHIKFYSSGYLSGAIKADNTLWIWGSGEYGQSTGFGNSPIQIAENVKFVDGGADHLVYVKNDGTAWGVGKNNVGQLGNGSTSSIPITVPVQMLNIQNAVRAVALGNNLDGNATTLILLSDGTTKITGGIDYFSNNSAISTPIIFSNVNNIVDIKGNFPAGYILNSIGEVYSFGRSEFGSLGLSTTITSTFNPLKITFPIGASPIVAISSNNDGYHALALDENGKVYAWGASNSLWGTLGDGTNTDRFSPVLVQTNCKDIFAGETFSYLLKTDNTLWASGQSRTDLGANASIWMNLTNIQRNIWTQINPIVAPMNLCAPIIFGTLPIELTNFNCFKLNNSDAIIKWSSENEINFKQFILEYCKDGINFKPIAIINAKGSKNNYEFIDQKVSGIAFYRLKLVDLDGRFNYSEIKKVLFTINQNYTVFPNPVNKNAYIHTSRKEKICQVQILSVDGKICKMFERINIEDGIDVSTLITGIYFIQITTTDNHVELLEMIKK